MHNDELRRKLLIKVYWNIDIDLKAEDLINSKNLQKIQDFKIYFQDGLGLLQTPQIKKRAYKSTQRQCHIKKLKLITDIVNSKLICR